jgi:hypothetical protein
MLLIYSYGYGSGEAQGKLRRCSLVLATDDFPLFLSQMKAAPTSMFLHCRNDFHFRTNSSLQIQHQRCFDSGAGQLLDDFVDHYGPLRSPLLDCHRSIADDVLAEDVLDVLHVTPALWISVLEPDEGGTDVGRAMLGVVHDNRLFVPSRHEDFDRFIVIAEATLVQRALPAPPAG